jgi:hypothetical protein
VTLPKLPEPNVTAPDWRTDPLGWCGWYLNENRHIYHAFRAIVDERLKRYPQGRVSADDAFHKLRWDHPINARGDLFALNNNATALFARLYIYERPTSRENFDLRSSFFDRLTPDEWWGLVLAARSSLPAEQPALLEAPPQPIRWRRW